jgi:HSP20 family protein|tara:strand:- start:73 stop:504 length:432 start_codon:yes stop_codon:yes gene_type:complete
MVTRFGNNVSRRVLGDVFTEMNKVFDTNFTEGILPLDIIEYDESFKIEVAVPGFSKEEMVVKVDDGSLVIHAEKDTSKEVDSEAKYLYRGITSFNFSRKLPNIEEKFKVDCEAITSAYENGILTITMPKKAELQPKTVDIEVR